MPTVHGVICFVSPIGTMEKTQEKEFIPLHCSGLLFRKRLRYNTDMISYMGNINKWGLDGSDRQGRTKGWRVRQQAQWKLNNLQASRQIIFVHHTVGFDVIN